MPRRRTTGLLPQFFIFVVCALASNVALAQVGPTDTIRSVAAGFDIVPSGSNTIVGDGIDEDVFWRFTFPPPANPNVKIVAALFTMRLTPRDPASSNDNFRIEHCGCGVIDVGDHPVGVQYEINMDLLGVYPAQLLLDSLLITHGLWMNYQDDASISYAELRLVIAPQLTIIEPHAGELWVSGEVDTIKWAASGIDSINILLSTNYQDAAGAFDEIVHALPASVGQYLWRIPDTILSRKCAIQIENAAGPDPSAVSDSFKIKPYLLTKLSANGDFVAYDKLTDPWGFRNRAVDMWPPLWYARFTYQGIDPFTNSQYSQWQGNSVFQTSSSSDFPDWISFVNTFTPGACYISQFLDIYSPTALQRWNAVKDQWNGSCFGIAVSNALAFGHTQQFFNRYPVFPGFTNPISVSANDTVRSAVNEVFAHQFGNPHLTFRSAVGLLKTPNQTLNDLKNMFRGDTGAVQTLSILNNGPGGGGHAILAWGLKQDTTLPKLYYVYVYDNSWADSTNARIVIDTTMNGNNGGWTYSLWPGWGGAKWIYLRDPAVNYLTSPFLPKISAGGRSSPFTLPPDQLQIRIKGAGSVRITDSLGNNAGYMNNIIRTDIPGSYPLAVDDGSIHPPYGYGLPSGPSSVALSEFQEGGNSEAFFLGGNNTFVAERSHVQAGETDRFFFNGGLSASNGDTSAKTVNVYSIINEIEREKTFRLGSVSLLPVDSIRVEPIASDGWRVYSTSSQSKTYNLEIGLFADTGVARFVVSGITLQAGIVTHRVLPDWNNLSGGILNILIDVGDDGSIDDTLEVTNEISGIDERTSRGVPDKFALEQNYPNPFNPVTTISFDLPDRSFVTLSVVNVLGQVVATLVNETKNAGYQSVKFTATDLPTGVYFYRLRAGNFTETKKMMVLK